MDDVRPSPVLTANVVVVFSLSRGKGAVDEAMVRLGRLRRNTGNLQLIVAILATIVLRANHAPGSGFLSRRRK